MFDSTKTELKLERRFQLVIKKRIKYYVIILFEMLLSMNLIIGLGLTLLTKSCSWLLTLHDTIVQPCKFTVQVVLFPLSN